jgi:hypothetical protein
MAAPAGSGGVRRPGLARAVHALAALAHKKVVLQKLLAPHARWQGRVAVGDESVGEAAETAIRRYRKPAAGEGHGRRRLAGVIQNTENILPCEDYQGGYKDSFLFTL